VDIDPGVNSLIVVSLLAETARVGQYSHMRSRPRAEPQLAHACCEVTSFSSSCVKASSRDCVSSSALVTRLMATSTVCFVPGSAMTTPSRPEAGAPAPTGQRQSDSGVDTSMPSSFGNSSRMCQNATWLPIVMVKRRRHQEAAANCHAFRATGIQRSTLDGDASTVKLLPTLWRNAIIRNLNR
jgi:hypothetical protein